MTDSWHSYPSIFNLGHAALAELLLDSVIVEEKVDGSQFSFGRFAGDLKMRSKGKQMDPRAPEKMFQKGADVVATLDLVDGWTYRCEYLQKPQHNGLAYDRIPANHLILFDVNTDHEKYLSYEEKASEANRLGLEVVPLLRQGMLEDAASLRSLLDTTSVLGGQKIEGFVVKNYARFGLDKKALMGKFVSEMFKEVQAKNWRTSNPGRSDILEVLKDRYGTPARWNKAVQHLAERGDLTNSPSDIELLMVEVQNDVLRECSDEIKDFVFDWAWEKARRTFAHGLPQWYKQKLLDAQFGAPEARYHRTTGEELAAVSS